MEELVPIKTLTAGTNIISIQNASNIIKISIIPRIETKYVYDETAFNIPHSNFTLVNGFCADLPEIDGEEKATKLQVAFFETSALSGENVEKAFEMMMNEVYKKCHDEMEAEDMEIIESGQGINLEKKSENTQPKQCCA